MEVYRVGRSPFLFRELSHLVYESALPNQRMQLTRARFALAAATP
jgi:hypothetical protein